MVEGVGLCEGQDHFYGPLKHLQLISDSAEWDFDPPTAQLRPLVIVLEPKRTGYHGARHGPGEVKLDLTFGPIV
jgi:hypothetical protein